MKKIYLAFLGPFLISLVTALTQSIRLGISVTILFFIIGLILMKWVPSDIETPTSLQ